nr:hypothetical protein CFP56_16751 [Quercus suber]
MSGKNSCDGRRDSGPGKVTSEARGELVGADRISVASSLGPSRLCDAGYRLALSPTTTAVGSPSFARAALLIHPEPTSVEHASVSSGRAGCCSSSTSPAAVSYHSLLHQDLARLALCVGPRRAKMGTVVPLLAYTTRETLFVSACSPPPRLVSTRDPEEAKRSSSLISPGMLRGRHRRDHTHHCGPDPCPLEEPPPSSCRRLRDSRGAGSVRCAGRAVHCRHSLHVRLLGFHFRQNALLARDRRRLPPHDVVQFRRHAVVLGGVVGREDQLAALLPANRRADQMDADLSLVSARPATDREESLRILTASEGACTKPSNSKAQIISLYFSFAADVVTDLAIMALPLRVVFGLQMTTRDKLSLAALFSTNIVAIVVSMIRVFTIWAKTGSASPSPAWLALWAVNECMVGTYTPSSGPVVEHSDGVRMKTGSSSVKTINLKNRPEMSSSKEYLNLEQQDTGKTRMVSLQWQQKTLNQFVRCAGRAVHCRHSLHVRLLGFHFRQNALLARDRRRLPPHDVVQFRRHAVVLGGVVGREDQLAALLPANRRADQMDADLSLVSARPATDREESLRILTASEGACTKPSNSKAQIISLYFSFAADVVTDLAIMALPLRVVFGLQMTTRDKLSLAALFSTNIVAIVVSMIRVFTIWAKTGSASPSPAWLALWAVNECMVGTYTPSSGPVVEHSDGVRMKTGSSSVKTINLKNRPEMSSSKEYLNLEQQDTGKTRMVSLQWQQKTLNQYRLQCLSLPPLMTSWEKTLLYTSTPGRHQKTRLIRSSMHEIMSFSRRNHMCAPGLLAFKDPVILMMMRLVVGCSGS